jgi:hypothetical protein
VQVAVVSLTVAIYLALIVLARLSAPVQRLTGRLLAALGVGAERAESLGEVVGRFLLALGVLRRPTTALAVAAWSIVVWLLGGAQYWTVMQAFHMDASFLAAMFVLGATALWAVLPSSPGYVGVFHHAIRVSAPAVVAGLTAERALSYAVVLHAVTFAGLVLLGVVGLLMLGLSFGDVVRRAGSGQAALGV